MNATTIEEIQPDSTRSEPTPKPKPKPKPKPRPKQSASEASSSSSDRRPRPVPAPRKNRVRIVRTRSRSGESSSASSSRVSTPSTPLALTREKEEEEGKGGSETDEWEDVDSDSGSGDKKKKFFRRSIRPSTVRKRGSLRRKPRPPRKPPRKPDSFGRAATLLEIISSDDQEGADGQTTSTATVDEKDDDNVYSDVAIVNSKRRASNPLAQRPLPPPPADQTPFRPNSRWRPEWDTNDDEIDGRRTQRSISFNVPESERLYNEPLIHRSRSISQTGSVASVASRSAPSSPSRPQPKQRRKPPKPRESAPIEEKEKKKSKKPPIPSKPRPMMLVRPDELRSVLESLKKVQLANKKKDRDPDDDDDDDDDGGGYCLPPARPTPPKPKPRRLALARKLSVSLEDIASPRPDASESRASTLSRSYSLHLGMVEVTRDGDYDDVGERLDVAGEALYHVLDPNQSCPFCAAAQAAASDSSVTSLDFVGKNVDMLFSFPCRHRRRGPDFRPLKAPPAMRAPSRRRTLWVEQPEVIESGVLDTLDEPERKYQEAQFELISSEMSYLSSLKILMDHFMKAPELLDSLPEERRVLDKQQRHVLFSNLPSVFDVATRFNESLQNRWKENCKVENLCDIIMDYTRKDFDVYVKYCSNQAYQHRLLEKLLATDAKFYSIIQKLESDPVCQSLALHSYLLLPMQRITRFPLLVVAILERTAEESPHYPVIQETLVTVRKLVKECNEGAKTMERMEQMIAISKLIRFPKIKAVPLISPKRWLLKRGPLVHCQVEKGFARIKTSLHNIYLFVFTDLLLVTKSKKQLSEEWYNVLDYAQRPFVQVEDIVDPPYTESSGGGGGSRGGVTPEEGYALAATGRKNVFKVVLLENSKKKTLSFLLSAESQTDKARWMHVIEASGQNEASAGETVYGEFDCPYAKATFDYKARQEDELSLREGDIIKVLRKMIDGWHEGQRLSDGEYGWFPSTYVEEIESEHSRARNLKKRYQLLTAATESFLEPPSNQVSVRKKSRLSELFG